MTANDPRDIEKALLSLDAKPVPPGLNKRILGSALKARRDLVLTPSMWAAATACAALIAVALLGDAALTRAQNESLGALLNGRAAAQAPVEDAGPLLAEIWEEIGDQERAGLERVALARPVPRSVSLRDVLQARERLKGWLDHEDEGKQSPD
jgi:hypothetical protein